MCVFSTSRTCEQRHYTALSADAGEHGHLKCGSVDPASFYSCLDSGATILTPIALGVTR